MMVMLIFFTILISVPLVAVFWWYWAHRRLRFAPRSGWWQLAVAAFSSVFVATFAWMVIDRIVGTPIPPHPWLMALLMIWGMIFLPFIALPSMLGWGVWRCACRVARRFRRTASESSPETTFDSTTTSPTSAGDEAFTRRQMIGASLVMFPMVASLGATAYSIPQKRRFRVRDIEVPIPDLPRALDGVRIAHISDTHVGTFTHGEVLDEIVRRTNQLDADLVVLTGDLINHSVDDLPAAMGMVRRLEPRNRVVMIEGNHDLFQGRDAFVNGVRAYDVPILLDEARTLRINNHPLQLLGIRWHFRRQPIGVHVDAAARHRDPDAFPILLAHHPHAFDRAAEIGIPLTLAGHTHGGQLMLTPEFGAGPAIYKYWSGLYQKGEHALVVSNGTGNWFPLRTSAPAEILHLVLRRSNG